MAILSFVAVLFCTATLGYHAPLHVFPPAIVGAILAAIPTAHCIGKYFDRSDNSRQKMLATLGGLALLGSLVAFFRIIT